MSPKGLKKRILVADGVLTTALMGMGMGRYFALGISVNGAYYMQPDSGVHGPPPGPEVVELCDSDEGPGMCAVVGHWWLDLDDPANAALLGVPLTVTLVGGDLVGVGGGPVDMSLRVRPEKK